MSVVRERASEPNRTLPHRYPLAPLVEASGLSEAEFGRRVGLSGSSLTKARRDGLIESAADRYACRAGLVPWLVWSDWLEDAVVECADEACTERFVPARARHRYCQDACRKRAAQRRWTRRKYRSDPEWAEAERERARAYYAECRDYVRSRQQKQRSAA